MYIYILELEQNKYYIGKSENAEIRIDNHINNKGAEWTKLYKIIKVIEVIPNCGNYDEDKYVFIYMNQYGINNVRGGSFVQIELNNEYKNVIQHILNSTNDLCYVCNLPGHFGNNCSKKIITKLNITGGSNENNDITCTRCKRAGHIRESCNYKSFKGGKKINKKKYYKNKLKV
jgi:hypothetical protein